MKSSYEFETLNLNRELAPKECTLVFSNKKKNQINVFNNKLRLINIFSETKQKYSLINKESELEIERKLSWWSLEPH